MLEIVLGSALRSLGLGLFVYLIMRLFKPRDPRLQMTIWTAFLVGALAMPVLVCLSPLSLPRTAIPWADAAISRPAGLALDEDDGAPAASPRVAAQAAPAAAQAPIDWRAIAADGYLAVCAGLLLRTSIGLAVMQRRRRKAQPLCEPWVGRSDVRVSAAIATPVTFGGTILLPPECARWSSAQRSAVLGHERAHVAAGDFYIQLLAVLHRAIFWFSPMSWWLLARLATLAETISDDAAIDALGDRASYAAILLDIASRARRAPFGVAMARHSRVSKRLDAILTETKTAPILDWRKKALVALAIAPAFALAASAVAQNAAPPPSTPGQGQAPQSSAIGLNGLDAYLGAFRIDPLVEPDEDLEVTRQGDHFFAQTTGGKPGEITIRKDGGFVLQGRPVRLRNVVVADGKATAFEFWRRDRFVSARRVDDSEAKRMEALHAQRLAEQAAPRNVVPVDPKLFDGYVGYYQLSDQKVFAVTKEGDRLFNQTTGQRKYEIFPESDQKFFYTISAAQVSFERDAEGRAVALVLHQYGRERRAPRITEAAANAINGAYAQRLAQEVRPHNLVAVDPKLFDGYVGAYQLSPSTVMTATREGDKLFMQFTGQDKFEIFPESGREYFYTIVAAQISFQTDDRGRATSLVLHQHGWDQVADRIE
jgi:BlaR1 peptidase M56/Domain of unknown function (DUF3471)